MFLSGFDLYSLRDSSSGEKHYSNRRINPTTMLWKSYSKLENFMQKNPKIYYFFEHTFNSIFFTISSKSNNWMPAFYHQ